MKGNYLLYFIFKMVSPVADPEFPRGGGANLLFGQKFPKNCIKMKEFGPGGGARVPDAPLPP